ncbi:hypothetical protein FRC08_012464 [Ceratobasidium sp. 394]|nr:hypothetical protein FRC08_012464 [Ceratobasidium sp. 394]
MSAILANIRYGLDEPVFSPSSASRGTPIVRSGMASLDLRKLELVRQRPRPWFSQFRLILHPHPPPILGPQVPRLLLGSPGPGKEASGSLGPGPTPAYRVRLQKWKGGRMWVKHTSR